MGFAAGNNSFKIERVADVVLCTDHLDVDVSDDVVFECHGKFLGEMLKL